MGESYSTTREKVLRIAARDNLVVTEAGVSEVFIDWDDVFDGPRDPSAPLDERPDDPTYFDTAIAKRIRTLAGHVHSLFAPVRHIYYRVSKGREGLHIRLVLAAVLTNEQRVTIAAAMGSDPKRELLRLKAIRDGTDDVPSIFIDNPAHPEHELSQSEGPNVRPELPSVRPELHTSRVGGGVEAVPELADRPVVRDGPRC